MSKKADNLAKLLTPLLPGANARDRALACLGAVLAITLTGALTSFAFRGDPHVPLLASPMGASAVLLFAVPASPLARSQPTNTLKTHDVPSALRAGFNSEDVDAALADLGEAFDIERDDIDRLLERVALRAMSRHASDPLCADIMSQDLITIGPDATLETARALLIEHNMRTLPVLNTTGHLLGSIDLRDLSGSGQYVRDKTRAAVTAHPTTPAAPTVAPPKSAPAARTAKSLDCSKQADAKSMHGKDRRKFMEKCKRS